MNSQTMDTQGYPAASIPVPESDSEEEVMGACGRCYCGEWDEAKWCQPNSPPKNSIEQFNVCPMKISTLKFLCGTEWEFSESSFLTPHELRSLLLNTYGGLLLSDPELAMLHDLISGGHSDWDWDSEEEVEEEEEEPPPIDTRPIINKQWIKRNPKKWKELNKTPDHCPVCFESEDVIWDGCLNHGAPTRCTHWFCEDCFDTIRGMGDPRRRRCPMCKDQW